MPDPAARKDVIAWPRRHLNGDEKGETQIVLERLFQSLVGFIELKAPGKGADPRKFKDPHDRAQWEKLHSLPNLLYTDGNAFSLWHDGELVDSVVTLIDDIESGDLNAYA